MKSGPAIGATSYGPFPRSRLSTFNPVELLLILAGAAGMFFGQPNTWLHLPPLVLLAPFCLFAGADPLRRGRHVFLFGWTLGLLGNLACLYWMVYPLRDVGHLPLASAIGCVVLLMAYLALFNGLICLGMQRLKRLLLTTARDGEPSAFALLALPLLCGLAYAGFEWLRGVLLTGFPWLCTSTAFAFWPVFSQAASLVGGAGLTALYAAAACYAACCVSSRSESRPESRHEDSEAAVYPFRVRVVAGLLVFLILAIVAGYGMWRLEAPSPEAGAAVSTPVLLVQGNIDQNQKWEPAFQEGTLEHYLRLSREGLAAARAKGLSPQLVFWPETAMPFYFQHQPEYATRLRAFARENAVALGFGAIGPHRGPGSQTLLYNRFYILDARGETVGFYDKEHLVPFGEYMPLGSLTNFLREMLQGMDFAPGENRGPLLLFRASASGPLLRRGAAPVQGEEPSILPMANASAGAPDAERGDSPALSLGPLICYEAIFPELAQKRVEEGATVLLSVSNDGWFRDTSAPAQHLGLAIMRAVEQSRPLVRPTNTGYTALVDARGRFHLMGGLFTELTGAGLVTPEREKTLYHRLYPAPECLAGLMALLSLIAHLLRKY